MVIVNIINSILQAMVDDPGCELKSWQYNDLSTSNVRLDNKKPSPTAVFLQISDWSLGANALNVKESADINISFLEKEGKLDAGGVEQDQIIDRMKALAIDFIQRLKNVSALKIDDDEYKIKSVFLRSDSNRSGVNIQLSVKERQGECINGTYDPVMTVTENGLYNVAGYTQIVVDLPECPECPECPCPPVPPVTDHLCITAFGPDVQISMAHYGTNQSSTKPTIYWTRNLQDYFLLDNTTIVLPNQGDSVYFYGNNPNGISSSGNNYSRFAINGHCAASGDVTRLLNRSGSDTIPSEWCFYSLFNGCTGLVSAPSLPATTLADYCYNQMFYGCTSLRTAPELPATTLANNCYRSMFFGCTSLVDAPELPATTLSTSCYYGMFSGCTGLTTAPELPATTLAEYCYGSMFSGCTSLRNAPALPATNLATYCYSQMFRGCTGLTTTPELPATTLADRCYNQMFKECSSLVQAPELASMTLADYCYNNMFGDCSSLAQAPELPATTLAKGCYNAMFMNCTSITEAPDLPAETLVQACYASMFTNTSITEPLNLGIETMAQSCYSGMYRGTLITEAPELPATTMAPSCYYGMFENCTLLVKAPALPATTLAENCYRDMFRGCTSLTEATELPVTTLYDNCYYGMFEGCTSLVEAPELPATTLAENCYRDMFYNCSSLVSVQSILPATTLAESCYDNMYRGCTSLVKAPELPATTLELHCYRYMFQNCTSLNYIKVNASSWSTSNASSWVDNVAPAGTFVKPLTTNIPTGTGGIPAGWSVVDFNYLCFTANSANSTVGMTHNGTNETTTKPVIYKSTDGIYWEQWDYTDITLANAGDKVFMYGNNSSGTGHSLNDYSSFTMTGSIAASGDITSIVTKYGTTDLSGTSYCLSGLLYNCTALTSTPELTATTLGDNCYRRLFQNCTSLTTAPTLPATTLASSCYCDMFSGCTGLATAPELPATTLSTSCYYGMFSGCTGLTTAPELPATTLAEYCYGSMFSGCTSLRNAPELPAETPVTGCYENMFNGCTSLSHIYILSTTWNEAYTQNWMMNVAQSGVFEKLFELDTIPVDSANGIPAGWTVELITYNYLCYTNVGETNATVYGRFWGTWQVVPELHPVIYYSTDKENWTLWDYSTITIPVNGKLYMYGDNPNGVYGANTSNYLMIKGSGSVELSGDLTTLLRQKGNVDELPEGAFANLFYFNDSIVSAEHLKLPSTVLSNICYAALFTYCNYLTKPAKFTPKLTYVPSHSMDNMYRDTALIEPVDLRNITSVQIDSFYYFYSNVTTLTYVYAPNVRSWGGNTSYNSPFDNWMNGVANSGTLYRRAGLYIPDNNASGCPTGWVQADYPSI